MSQPGAIIVGWIRKGRKADCGETMKNQLMIKRLEELGVHCRQMDFKGWKRRPWVLLQLAWNMLIHHRDTLILSSSPLNIYPMMRLLKFFRWKQNCIHWVIGGIIGPKVRSGELDPKIVGYMNHTIVESPAIADDLNNAGINGVMTLPNFKPISYLPDINHRSIDKIRFVFLSRIIPEKGCDYIFEAIEKLNGIPGMAERFLVDFYGAIGNEYRASFNKKIESHPNARYRGFLNLNENTGYDTLASYNMMLFPTYWKGECFAGVFIDSFIAGLPIIASDWAHNKIFLEEGKTALFVPTHDVAALIGRMKDCIDGNVNLTEMSRYAQAQAQKYDIRNVITKELITQLDII